MKESIGKALRKNGKRYRVPQKNGAEMREAIEAAFVSTPKYSPVERFSNEGRRRKRL
jgi:hypothetical protein